MATPRQVRRELEQAGFELNSVSGSSFPHRSRSLVTPWHYYAAVKRGPASEHVDSPAVLI